MVNSLTTYCIWRGSLQTSECMTITSLESGLGKLDTLCIVEIWPMPLTKKKLGNPKSRFKKKQIKFLPSLYFNLLTYLPICLLTYLFDTIYFIKVDIILCLITFSGCHHQHLKKPSKTCQRQQQRVQTKTVQFA